MTDVPDWAKEETAAAPDWAKEEPSSGFSWSRAVTDVPGEIKKEAGSALSDIAAVKNRVDQGPVEGLMTTGKAVLAVPRLIASPFVGAGRSLIGHSMTNLEHLAGQYINPEVAAKDNPEAMYEASKGDVDKALSAARPAGVPLKVSGAYEWAAPPPSGPPPTPPPPKPPNEVAAAAERISDASGLPVEVPRAFASDNIAVQRAGQLARNVPIVGDSIPQATGRMADQLSDATKAIASSYGEGSGPNVANRIGQTLQSSAEGEASAASAAARRSDDALLAAWQRDTDAAHQAIAAREASSLEQARRAVGDLSPQDMGETLIARLRQGEREAHATKERLYGIAANSDGAIDANAVQGIRGTVMRSLDEQGVVVDPMLTPAAQRMLAELDNTAAMRMPSAGVSSAPERGAAQRTTVKSSSPAPANADAAPPSLLQFLAEKGGLGPDAELEAIGAHGHTVNVEGIGRRKLVRQGGWPLDYAREAAEEAGYLRGDHNRTSTVNDLLDVIDAEMRGQKRYPQGYEGTVTRRDKIARSEREQHEHDAHMRGFDDDLSAAGYGGLGTDVKKRAVRLMADEGMDADTAVDHAFRQLEQEDNAIRGSGFPGDRIQQPENSATSPVDMKALEQTRKRLNFLSQTAQSDGDRRAARHVIKSFDDWLNNAFDKSLFSGSDEALQAYKDARAANADWRRRFGYNERDDADKLINKVVTGEVTPQELSNWIVGSTQVGSKGVSSRLLTRLAEATSNDPQALQAIRGGVWNRLSQATEGATERSPERIANGIYEFLNGSGRDVAQRLFSPDQQNLMRTYADTLRRGAEGRQLVSDVAKATKPQSMEVGVGPMQELAQSVLGKGGKTDEALFSAVDAYARSGARGDIKTLSDILRSVPQKDRGDLAGAIVRKLGQSKTTGDFSLDLFASEWNKYSAQAKTLLFGNAGPQRQALDDIAKISQRYKDVGRRFGNPSGTAQNVTGMGALAAIFTNPWVAIPSLIGGWGFAKILSSPIGAQNAARWGKAATALSQGATAARIASFSSASNALATSANKIGARVSGSDFLRAIQGPVPAGADQKQPQSPGKLDGQPDRTKSEGSHKAHGGPVRLATGGAANHNHNPTEAQKKAGNYAKTHKSFHGLDISIENLKGSERSGVSKGGKAWSVKMPAHYGYIKGTTGADKDHVDCYMGPNQRSDQVFVVDQMDHKTGRFDEHKCLLGFNSEKEAKDTYLAGFSDGKNRIKHIRRMTIDEFKAWLRRGDTSKPIKAQDAGLRIAYRVKANP